MEELLKNVQEKTGLSPDQARSAIIVPMQCRIFLQSIIQIDREIGPKPC